MEAFLSVKYYNLNDCINTFAAIDDLESFLPFFAIDDFSRPVGTGF